MTSVPRCKDRPAREIRLIKMLAKAGPGKRCPVGGLSLADGPFVKLWTTVCEAALHVEAHQGSPCLGIFAPTSEELTFSLLFAPKHLYSPVRTVPG